MQVMYYFWQNWDLFTNSSGHPDREVPVLLLCVIT
jgi:hypothetical protein